MTRCGSRLTSDTHEWSCVKDVDESGAHLDGHPRHVDASEPGAAIIYRAEWTTEDATRANEIFP